MEIELTKTKTDKYGNERYIIHFLSLLSEEEQINIESQCKNFFKALQVMKVRALEKSRPIGGKPYSGVDYGGGIVFQGPEEKIKVQIAKILN